LNMTKQKKKTKTNKLTKAMRALGGVAGASIGTALGAPITGYVGGRKFGEQISKWLGSGDYIVQSNTLVKQSKRASSSIPAMHNLSQSIVVRHKEYLGNLTSKTNFAIRSSLVLNPGLDDTFPWLAQIARAYQEYRFLGIVIHYVPTSGMALTGTNPSLGSVMMQTSYRSNDSAPTDKVEMMNEYCASEARPSEAFCHPIECNPVENPLAVQYVRSTAIPSGDSPLMYDLGVTYVAVEGQLADNNILGDLWITYEVELKKPVLRTNVTSSTLCDIILNSTSITGANLFPLPYSPTAPGSWTGNDLLGITTGTNRITFPSNASGNYLVQVVLFGTTGWNSYAGTTITFNFCTEVTSFNPGTFNTSGIYTSGTAWIVIQTVVNIHDAENRAYLTFSTGTLTPTSTSAAVIIFITPI